MKLRAGMALLAICWLASAAAQNTNADVAEVDRAKEQQQRQVVQPLNNAPVMREIRSGQAHSTQVRGRETGVLIQSEGETWRAARVPIATVGGILLGVVLLGLIGFYLWRGPIGVHGAPTGRKIQRFTPAKRIAHWSVAITFVLLAITGLIITFGKSVLLPLIGYTLFSWLAIIGKNVHNFVGPVFSIVVPVMILLYIGDNLPRSHDWAWIKRFGGMLDRRGNTHVPSGKFNAGEKALFWALLVFLSMVLIVSGYILNFPNFDQSRQTMQISNVVHAIAALLATAMALFHIYLGTIGMRGAYDAMRHGYVDETWAKEHHEYWYNDMMSGRARGETAPPLRNPPGVSHRPA